MGIWQISGFDPWILILLRVLLWFNFILFFFLSSKATLWIKKILPSVAEAFLGLLLLDYSWGFPGRPNSVWGGNGDVQDLERGSRKIWELQQSSKTLGALWLHQVRLKSLFGRQNQSWGFSRLPWLWPPSHPEHPRVQGIQIPGSVSPDCPWQRWMPGSANGLWQLRAGICTSSTNLEWPSSFPLSPWRSWGTQIPPESLSRAKPRSHNHQEGLQALNSSFICSKAESAPYFVVPIYVQGGKNANVISTDFI